MSLITDTPPRPEGWIAETQEEYLRAAIGPELYEALEEMEEYET